MTDIVYGHDHIDEIKNTLSCCAFSVTDSNVARLYPELTSGAYVIPAGEKSKTPDTLFKILAAMRAAGVKRGDVIAAVGGGVVGDVTGLAAALYMRGVKWVCIPTTLLAAVDSCIGGKTAVDFCGVKNLVGAFHEPIKAIISYEFLKTLDKRELLCGVGEIVKTCLLTDKAYNMLRDSADRLCALDLDGVYPLIGECIEIKKSVVERDPEERGLRKVLNVGHTVGHALESVDGFKLSHGEYVLKGIMTECAMFRDASDSRYCDEVISLCKRLTTPPRTSANAVSGYAESDKKNVAAAITVMLPSAVGEVKELRVDPDEFGKRYTAALAFLKRK